MNQVIVSLQRQENKDSKPYLQKVKYEDNMHVPVTTMLDNLNKQEKLTDIDGKEVRFIQWSCSCQQGLCGSCAMRINGVPVLGCQAFCDENINKDGEIVIEPLTKFPVISDFIVDRSEMFEVMKNMKLWLTSDAKIEKRNIPFEYKVSQCLMCGCCLEACPNYQPGDLFAGLPSAVAAVKIVEQEEEKVHKREIEKAYNKRIFKGCVKSLACKKVCPMQIPTEVVLSKMNQVSVWNIWKMILNR